MKLTTPQACAVASIAAAVAALFVRLHRQRACSTRKDRCCQEARLRVYLAGPEVFLPRELAMEVANRKRAICAKYGLEGVCPMDLLVDTSSIPPGTQRAVAIAAKDHAIMRSVHLGIACLTPFRGVSADVGTAYEVGFLRGQGKAVFCYTHDARPYDRRVREDGAAWPGMTVEEFEGADNLMLVGAAAESGGSIVAPARSEDAHVAGRHGAHGTSSPESMLVDLRPFEDAVKQAASWAKAAGARAFDVDVQPPPALPSALARG